MIIVYFFLNAVHTFFGIDDMLVFGAKWYWWINVPIIVLFEILYMSFLKSFLIGILKFKKLDMIYKWSVIFFLLLIPLHFICVYFNIDNSIVFLLSHILISVYGISVFKALYNQNTRMTKLVSIGIIANVLGGTVTIIMSLLGQHGISNLLTVSYPIVFFRIGVLFDIFFYQMALLIKWQYQEKQLLIREIESKILVENVKTKINHDLHDDIGNTLSSISRYAEVAKRKAKRNEEVDDILTKIHLSSEDLVGKMSDIIWSLNSDNETLEKLLERVQNFCATIFPEQGIHFIFEKEIESETKPRNQEILKELFLIIKESLNNCMKHAQCSRVSILFFERDNYFKVVILDDGIGFETLQTKHSLGGNGLKNMKYRAEQIQAKLEINSGINLGTEINLEVLLS